MSFLYKIFGDPNVGSAKGLVKYAEQVNVLEKDFEKLSELELKAKTEEFKNRLKKGETLDNLLPEAFATVREAAKRTMGMRHFDVQIMGGAALHLGKIAEMRTGEGKTLVATLPTYLNALEGKGVHVVTVNDYLAKRDAVWMGQIYDYLGMSVGVAQNLRVSFIYDASFVGGGEGGTEDQDRDETGSFKVEDEFLRPVSRQEVYRCDITYGTNNEFGFDYLRDNMVQDLKEMVMRPESPMHYAIIDEVDSILIDEARTPLIISAPAAQATDQYYRFAKLVTQLKENEDYNIDEKMRASTLTEEGINKFEKWLGVENIYAEGGMAIVHHIEQALKAEVLFKRDKEYVVDENEIVIIDEFTGRKMPGRRYSEGLHQAIEAKENVVIQRESQTLATITFQNLFRMYKKLSGMTGTAVTEAEEFQKIYTLDVIAMPTNKPDVRIDHSDRIYRTEVAKNAAIVKQIKECQERDQPILVGTISVEKNEQLSEYLTANGIEHEALNAKNHEREGEIVAQAGRPGAVTLATNMAGRGVDIKLGGNPINKVEADKVLNAGGLFVLGTERHDARRIDNQLRGRSARQGDKGETHFFVSTEDDLMRIFAGDRMKTVMERLRVPDDMPIEQKMISKMLETAQKKVEGHNFDMRKHLLEYDDVLNKQRHSIYKRRRDVLEKFASNESIKEIIMGMIESEIKFIISFHTNVEEHKDWDMKEVVESVKTIFSLSSDESEKLMDFGKKSDSKLGDVGQREEVVKFLLAIAEREYQKIENGVISTTGSGEEGKLLIRSIEKGVVLRAIDTLWVEHLVSVDYLRTGIGLQGYGQRDPLVEYKKETFRLFNDLQTNIQKEVVYSFYKVGVGLQLAPSIMDSDKLTLKGAEKNTSEASGKKNGGRKIGRNELVKITNGIEVKEIKFKKAEQLLGDGSWKLV